VGLVLIKERVPRSIGRYGQSRHEGETYFRKMQPQGAKQSVIPKRGYGPRDRIGANAERQVIVLSHNQGKNLFCY